MKTALITHPDIHNHVNPPGHLEQVARLQSVLAALEADRFAGLVWIEALPATDANLLKVHPAEYLSKLETLSPESGTIAIDADTSMCPGSLRAARLAAGAVVQAVDLVMAKKVRNVFCATRPPGHHAETDTAMGFCFFGNVVAGARHALDEHGLERVAIMDFDVHHGNGTQDLVWNDARILYASTHQMPLYPGTGSKSETGAHGQIYNAPLPAGAGGAEFRSAMERDLLPAIEAFQPQLIIISAGFDAHADDPLASLNFTEDDFVWATNQLCDIADRHAGGRVVSTLEGGYDLAALASCAAAHTGALMERDNG